MRWPADSHPVGLRAGTPVAGAVVRGRAAFDRGDADRGDAAYLDAVERAATGSVQVWSALAVDHVVQLINHGRLTVALQRCSHYLSRVEQRPEMEEHRGRLAVLRAEIRSAVADHAGARADALALRAELPPAALTAEDAARLHRVVGLAAADLGELDAARLELAAARQGFLDAGLRAGADLIDRDLLMVAVRHGEEGAAASVLAHLSDPPAGPSAPGWSATRDWTASEYLLVAKALRLALRYEEAQHVLRLIDIHRLDPALHWPVLHERAVLLRLTHQDEAMKQLVPWLRGAAAVAADPAQAAVALARLSTAGVPAGGVSPQLDQQIQQARRLVADARYDEAGQLLDELSELARADRDVAAWHLAAGVLALARGKQQHRGAAVREAVGWLSQAASAASAGSLAEIRVEALRLMGDAYDYVDDDRAMQCWVEAHRLEEQIAGLQISDQVRVRMLLAAPDEHDRRIQVAAERAERDPAATGAVVMAMEAARGATILTLLSDHADPVRNPLGPNDVAGALRWAEQMADALPRSQVAWLVHATEGHVHHAVLGRRLIMHRSVPCPRATLAEAVSRLSDCWQNPDALERSIVTGEFTSALARIADLVGVSRLLPCLPAWVRRIALVAARELSDVPFAALAASAGAEPIGLRYALSDLPSLATRSALQTRSAHRRGERLLLVSPWAGSTPAPAGWARTALVGESATLHNVRDAIKGHHQVRFDCHGTFNPRDARASWLQLRPDGPAGRLTPQLLEGMNLRGCGTLILGACESGMGRRTGRDERTGFVRAAFHAGAASVLAARWVARDAVSGPVLDRFQRCLRYLPRDVALQRALRDLCRGALSLPDLTAVDHPARWACWTLYGDAGRQTRAGVVRRTVRRRRDERRHHATPH